MNKPPSSSSSFDIGHHVERIVKEEMENNPDVCKDPKDPWIARFVSQNVRKKISSMLKDPVPKQLKAMRSAVQVEIDNIRRTNAKKGKLTPGEEKEAKKSSDLRSCTTVVKILR